MSQRSKEAYKKCEVKVDKGRYFWVNRRDVEVKSEYDNWAQIFDKCDPEKQKYRYELMPNTKFQPCRRFVRNDLIERKIKICRKASEKFSKFKEKLGLDPQKLIVLSKILSARCKSHLKEKLFRLSAALKTKDLMLTFLNTNLTNRS